jgi:hypothetical protein
MAVGTQQTHAEHLTGSERQFEAISQIFSSKASCLECGAARD